MFTTSVLPIHTPALLLKNAPDELQRQSLFLKSLITAVCGNRSMIDDMVVPSLP
jgi:hypothetical protein